MTPDDIRQQIEMQVVELIKKGLEDGLLTEERAQQISRRVLDLLKPGMSFEELYKAISKLDDTAPELATIVLPVMREYEQNVTQKAQATVRELIRQGKFDAAIKLAQDAINQNVKLEWTGSGKPK